jgi:hypothetical protein
MKKPLVEVTAEDYHLRLEGVVGFASRMNAHENRRRLASI